MADNKAYQKKTNISLVMQTIRDKQQISRIDISRELGLDRSTITNIVSKLLINKILIELAVGQSRSKGGRKPVLLGINSNFGIVLGLEIQVNFYHATLIGLDGTHIWNKQGVLGEQRDLFFIIMNIYGELQNEIEKVNIPLLGIGIGVPGQVDPIIGEILSSSPFFKESKGCKERLSKEFSIPLVFDNDANCCAWGVLEHRKGKGLKNFLYSIIELHDQKTLTTDCQIGFGIAIDGSLYYGHDFAAGELWDSLVDQEEDITLNEYFNKLIDMLSLFVSFLNPSHLFLGGEFIKYKDLVLDIAEKCGLSKKCDLVFSSQKQYEVSFGAASMFIERLFKIPGINQSYESELTWNRIFEIKDGVN